MTPDDMAPNDLAPECVQVRTNTTSIGQQLVDAVTLETSLAVWNHASGRKFLPNLRLGDDVIELDPRRAREAAARLRRTAAHLDQLADDAEELTRLEGETTALLDGRARTAAV